MDEHEGPRVLLGHFMADGSITSTGQPLIGQSMRVGLTDLALARPHIGLMSHIHLAQRFEWDGVPYHYMGSSHRTDYGQLERKTVLLSTFEGDQLVEVREIETPCARMFHVVDEYGLLDSSDHRTWLVGLGGEPADREHYRGAEVRFRYRVAADYREEAKARAHGEIAEYFREHGVADLKIEEEVIGKSAARAPEVALASSLPDKLRALWKRRNETLAPEREQSLIDMASELEAEEAA
jgi:DNA repair exonuclease SbcCD nuclease subunit